MVEEIKSLEELKPSSPTDILEETSVKREPIKDSLGRSYATGKRKDAVARVWIKAGVGKIIVNGKLIINKKITNNISGEIIVNTIGAINNNGNIDNNGSININGLVNNNGNITYGSKFIHENIFFTNL